MPLVFEPPVEPSVGGASMQTTARVDSTGLGDGYSQRSVRGINSLQRSVTLSWVGLTKADADEIVAFFAGQQGATNFWYLVPADTVSRQWVAKSWTQDPDRQLTQRVSAEFVQVFDL